MSSKFRDELDDYDLVFQDQTRDAWLFSDDEGERVWLPKSQVELDGSPVTGKTMSVTVPNWLAEEKGLI